MKNILKIVRNIILGVIMVVYFSFIVVISTLLLNKNEYGVTQFDEKAMILVDEKISNDNYPDGSLVVVEARELKDLKVGEEVFIYQPNKKDNSVEIIISEVESVHLDVDSPYITMKVTYKKQTKQEYLTNLKRAFMRNKWIDVNIWRL